MAEDGARSDRERANESRLEINQESDSIPWDRLRTLANIVRERTDVPTTFLIWEGCCSIPEGTDLLVNATSIGLAPATEARVRFNTATLRPGLIVSDS
jgi:hypothetical protein